MATMGYVLMVYHAIGTCTIVGLYYKVQESMSSHGPKM